MKKRIVMFLAAAMAAMCASAEPTVSNEIAKQRYPWNGLVDITCKVTGITGTTNGLKFAMKAVMPSFWVVKGGTNSTDLAVHTNGNYRLLWDARADLGEMRHTNMVVRVTVAARNSTAHDKVQLWAGGPYWATTNIGADEPWDYGYYFWWGDTVGYKWVYESWVASDGSSSDFSFDDVNTPTCNKSIDTLESEGWITEDGVLAPEHDAAHVQWGGSWRMPTKQELSDLNSYCDWTRTTTNGVNGYVVRGRGDYASASIFLPCAGDGFYLPSLSTDRSGGDYWSSVPSSDLNDHGTAWNLGFNSGGHVTYNYYRHDGRSVRPVQGFTE